MAVGLRARRMTLVTNDVRVRSRRDRESHAAARRLVTRRATDTRRSEVASVIELDSKTLQRRKRFQRPLLNVGVTDGADRAARIRELLGVTSGAGQVAALPRPRRLR